MAMEKVALCASRDCLENPALLGLPDERLDAQEWLTVFDDATSARAGIAGSVQINEAWVASCSDIEPINLAATIKRERPDIVVCMLAEQESGSLRSRTSTSGIDALMSRQALVARYGARKARAREQHRALERLSEREQEDGGASEKPSRKGGAVSPRHGAAEPSARATRGEGGGTDDRLGAAGEGRDARVATDDAPEESPCGKHSAPALQGAPASRKALLVPVVGGSGGVGKSSVAVLAALASRNRGLKTALLDFDLQFGDAADLLGIEDAVRLDDLVRDPQRARSLGGSPSRLAVLSPPAHIDGAEDVVRGADGLLDALEPCFDVIVANTGGAWAEQHAVLLERASKTIFLIDQRPGSLRACRHALDLCARCGIATSAFQFALNRCSKGSTYTSIDISCALGGARVHELRDGGAIVEELLAAGLARELFESKNPFVASVDSLMATMLPAGGPSQAPVPQPTVRPSLLGRLGRRQRRAACL